MTCQEMRKHLACLHGVIIERKKGKSGKKRTSSMSGDSTQCKKPHSAKDDDDDDDGVEA